MPQREAPQNSEATTGSRPLGVQTVAADRCTCAPHAHFGGVAAEAMGSPHSRWVLGALLPLPLSLSWCVSLSSLPEPTCVTSATESPTRSSSRLNVFVPGTDLDQGVNYGRSQRLPPLCRRTSSVKSRLSAPKRRSKPLAESVGGTFYLEVPLCLIAQCVCC